MAVREAQRAQSPCGEIMDRPHRYWAWPVSWAFLCGAVASGAFTWPDRWRAIVFILWFIADPFTAALTQGVWAIRRAWQGAQSLLGKTKPFGGRPGAFLRALVSNDSLRYAIVWAGVALAGAFVLTARQNVEMRRLVLFLAGSVVLLAASEQGSTYSWTTGLRVAWAWLLGYWAFAPLSALALGLGLLTGLGVGASLSGERGSSHGVRWLGRLAAWAATCWLLWVRQPFLVAMGAAVALNWEALFVSDARQPPRVVWRLAWLGLGMLIAVAQASGVTS